MISTIHGLKTLTVRPDCFDTLVLEDVLQVDGNRFRHPEHSSVVIRPSEYHEDASAIHVVDCFGKRMAIEKRRSMSVRYCFDDVHHIAIVVAAFERCTGVVAPLLTVRLASFLCFKNPRSSVSTPRTVDRIPRRVPRAMSRRVYPLALVAPINTGT